MGTFDVRVEGMAALRQDFADLSDRMQRQALAQGLKAAASVVLKDARKRVPRGKWRGGGRALKALGSYVRVTARDAQAKVGAKKGAKHGPILHLLELGVAPHRIPKSGLSQKVMSYPTAGKSLGKSRGRKIQGPVQGGRVFLGRVVQHPGYAARPFLRPALENNREEVLRKFRSATRQIIDAMKLRVLKKQGG